MSGEQTYIPKGRLARWFEKRLPILGFMHSSFVAFPNPRNLNYWWTFGGILSFMLVAQIATGVVLVMHYTPQSTLAFASVEHIMRDINYGWLLRYAHANGASMFFLALYIHIFRGMYYGSYKEPREVLWLLGVTIYLLSIATAFLGYVLPWGQMSFWGATVITSLFSAIPVVGNSITIWLWGGYAVDNATLNRFFALHYLLPFMIAGVVVLHIWALHVPGSNNPAGIEKKSSKDTLPFHPYFTVKDGFALVCFLVFYGWFVFYTPNYLSDADNYIGDVRRGADYRLPALARHVQSQIGDVPAALQDSLLAFCYLRSSTRLPRIETAGGRLCDRGPRANRLLFYAFSRVPAITWNLREVQTHPSFDLRRRPGEAWPRGEDWERPDASALAWSIIDFPLPRGKVQ